MLPNFNWSEIACLALTPGQSVCLRQGCIKQPTLSLARVTGWRKERVITHLQARQPIIHKPGVISMTHTSLNPYFWLSSSAFWATKTLLSKTNLFDQENTQGMAIVKLMVKPYF